MWKDVSRRLVVLLCLLIFGLGFGQVSHAQTQPVLIYADGAKSGWNVGGWSKLRSEVVLPDGQRPLAVTMDGWNALTFNSAQPFPIDGYKTLTLLINGSDKGKQELKLSLKLGDTVVSKEISLTAKKNEWSRYDIPFSKLGIKGGKFDAVFINNSSGESMSEYFVNYVLIQ